jgi:hypothetical protein
MANGTSTGDSTSSMMDKPANTCNSSSLSTSAGGTLMWRLTVRQNNFLMIFSARSEYGGYISRGSNFAGLDSTALRWLIASNPHLPW